MLSKPLAEYTEQDLNRVFGIDSVNCPHCLEVIQVSHDLHETKQTIDAHIKTCHPKNMDQVEQDLTARVMTEIVWRHNKVIGGKR